MSSKQRGCLNMSQKFLRLPAVKDYTGLSRSSIYALMEKREFPSQIKIGPRAVGWLDFEIEEWVSQRIKASR